MRAVGKRQRVSHWVDEVASGDPQAEVPVQGPGHLVDTLSSSVQGPDSVHLAAKDNLTDDRGRGERGVMANLCSFQ